MNEPELWPDGDDAPPELQQLLSFAEAPRPLDAGARERSRRRVLALASLPAAAGVLFWVQHFALGALLGGVVSVGVAAKNGVFSRKEAPVPGAVSAPVRSSAPRAADRAAPLAEVAPERVAEPPRPAVVTSAPVGSAFPLEDGSDGVAAEVRLLEAARRALTSDPTRALDLLAQHEREFSAGVLTTEREFLAIDALVRAGRRREAEARGQRLRERVPGSLYEERVERILEKGR